MEQNTPNPSNPNPNDHARPSPPGPDDPRFAFAVITDPVGKLIEATTADMLANPTPCSDFTVKELLEHLVHVMDRVAVVGRGEHWASVQQTPMVSGWAEAYRDNAHAVMTAWTDPAVLETVLEVPWGAFPGAVLMHNYAGELAVHGWDLATATGLDFALDDDVLRGALIAAKFIPAEGRDTPEIPFDPPVDPGPNATVLDELAGWMGRNVAG